MVLHFSSKSYYLVLVLETVSHLFFKSMDTAQKMKFSIKNFFSKCDQIRSFLKSFIFTEEILNEKLHFLCSGTIVEINFCMEKCLLKLIES